MQWKCAVCFTQIFVLLCVASFGGQVNLLQNGDFETGSLSPWTGSFTNGGVDVTSFIAHSGMYSGELFTNDTSTVTLEQQFNRTTKPAVLTFWVNNQSYDSNHQQVDSVFNVIWDLSETVLSVTNLTLGTWEEFQIALPLIKIEESFIQFQAQGKRAPGVDFFIDDVSIVYGSLSPVPEPSSMLLSLCGLMGGILLSRVSARPRRIIAGAGTFTKGCTPGSSGASVDEA